MTDRETAGAKWFREEKERRARLAADTERALRRKGLDALARARTARERGLQGGFAASASQADEERALLGRILAEPDDRARERLEAELQRLRDRMKLDAARQAQGRARRPR
jgi:hypothetical protein